LAIKEFDAPLPLMHLGTVDPSDMASPVRPGENDFHGPEANFLARPRQG
jgi:hypothetical protein